MMRSFDIRNPRAVFFQVSDFPSKLQKIAETVRFHFFKKEKFVFFVEDEKAQKFLDDLLWKLPETGFLPHSIDETGGGADWVTITKLKTHHDAVHFAFNLCSTPLLLTGLRIVYEFEDLSSANKQNLSLLRYNAYKEARIIVESR